MGCISVSLPKENLKKSESVSYTSPKAPFEGFFPSHLDAAWRTPDGSSISYLSECDPKNDVSLANIQKGLASSVPDGKVISQKAFNLKKWHSLRSVLSGTVDQIESKVDFVVFQEGGCTFILTYVARPAVFTQHLSQFEEFMQSFEVKK